MGRIKYLINSFFIMLVGGTVYSYSIFRKPIEEYLSISSYQSGLPFKFFLLFFAFSMPLSGYLIEKAGIKKTYVFGSLMIVLSWIFSSFISSIWCFVVSYGILGGIGTGVLYGVPLKVVSLWFYDKKGIATGITLAGFGLSSFVASQIFKILILNYDILKSFFYFGFIAFVLLTICFFNLKLPTYSSQQDIVNSGIDTKDILKRKEFYLVYFSFLFVCSFSLTAVSFTAYYFINLLNISFQKASYILSSMAVLNTLGRPIFGYLSDKMGFVFVSLVSFLMYLLSSIIAILYSKSFYSMLFFFSIFWLNLGGWLSIAPVGTMRFFGLLHYSKNYGVVYTAYGIGALVGMNLINLGYDLFFGYVGIVSFAFIVFLIYNYNRINYNY